MNLRLALILFCVLSVSVSALIYAETRPPPALPERDPAVHLYIIETQDIEQVRVVSADSVETFILTFDDWIFERLPKVTLNTDRWGGILLLLGGPKSSRVLLPKVDDPILYGLDDPNGIITLGLRGNLIQEINLGDKTPDGVNYYATVKGKPELFLVDAVWGDVLIDLAIYPPLPFWYFQLEPDQISAFAIRQEEVKIGFRKNNLSEWIFDDDTRAPVDEQRWIEIRALLTGPNQFAVLDQSFEDPSLYGMSDSSLILSIQYDLPKTLGNQDIATATYRIGRRLEDGSGYYAEESSTPELLFFDAAWVKALLGVLSDPPRSPAQPSTESAAVSLVLTNEL